MFNQPTNQSITTMCPTSGVILEAGYVFDQPMGECSCKFFENILPMYV